MRRLLLALVLVAGEAGAQCRCEKDFEWLRETFEANDAGFEYIVGRKGQAAYDLHNALTLEKIRAAKTERECTEAMREWLGFFRRGHIGLSLLSPETARTPALREVWDGDIAKFEKAAATDDPLTGVWEFPGAYKMGLVKDGDGYMARVIESSYDDVKVGDPILKTTRGRTTFYNEGLPTATIDGAPEVIADRLMSLLGQVTLRRAGDGAAVDRGVERYLKIISDRDWTPWIEQLDPRTMYIRIRSFDRSYAEAIEELVEENFEKLTSTENLIIDVRGNGGGVDGSFAPLKELFYTTPVRHPNVSFRASELNIAQYEELTVKYAYEPDSAWGTLAARMKAAPGGYVPLRDESIGVETSDSVYEYPQRVGIIVDERCGSSTEQFLFVAKQSWKVKLFGVPTRGALDVSNMLEVTSPDGRWMLDYTSSIADRAHGMPIDDTGFQPDYYLDSSIPRWQWVDHVKDILNYE